MVLKDANEPKVEKSARKDNPIDAEPQQEEAKLIREESRDEVPAMVNSEHDKPVDKSLEKSFGIMAV